MRTPVPYRKSLRRRAPRAAQIQLAAFAALVAMGAHAGGFIVHDLSTVAADARAALGVGFIRKAEAARLILSCLECKGEHVVDVQLGRQDDGTEQRVRSGQTTMARLEALCRARSPTCTLSALEVSPAVGWITTYPLGAGFGSTAVVLRDGDLLTIRSLAADEPTAKSNAEKTLKAVAGKVVGKQRAEEPVSGRAPERPAN